jgi:hypothetical protein
MDVVPLHHSYVCNPLWGTRSSLWANVYVCTWPDPQWIYQVSGVRVGLTGFHPFIRLTNTYTDVYIYPSLDRTRIEGGGTIEYYLFIKGILTYYSEPAWIIAYYSI